MSHALGVTPALILGAGRTRSGSYARQLLAYVWIEVLGRPASDLARAAGRTRSTMTWAAQQGSTQAATRQADIDRWCRR